MTSYKPIPGGYKHRAWITQARQNTDRITEILNTLQPVARGRAKDLIYEALAANYDNQRLYTQMFEELDWQEE